MDFFFKLLGCGNVKQIKRKGLSVKEACSQNKNQETSEHQEMKKTCKSKKVKLVPSNTKIKTQMISISPKNSIIAKIIKVKENYSSETPFRNGYLIGVMNNLNEQELLLEQEYYLMRIGKGYEIDSIANLREKSMDNLLIYWAQKGTEYTLKSIVLANQPLVFVLTSYEQIQHLINQIQEELLLNLADKPLGFHMDKLECSISIFKNRIIVQFGNNLEHQQNQLRKTIKRLLKKQIDEEILKDIMTKITLNQYICLSNNPESMQAKIEELYDRIIKESMNRNTLEDQGKKVIQPAIDEKIKQQKRLKSQISLDKEDLQSDENDKFSYFNQRKSSNEQEQALYFASKTNLKTKDNNIQDQNIEEQSLEIFYFNNLNAEDDNQTRESNQIHKKEILPRKFRSRSQDINYQPEECLDDEFFDKYS